MHQGLEERHGATILLADEEASLFDIFPCCNN